MKEVKASTGVRLTSNQIDWLDKEVKRLSSKNVGNITRSDVIRFLIDEKMEAKAQ